MRGFLETRETDQEVWLSRSRKTPALPGMVTVTLARAYPAAKRTSSFHRHKQVKGREILDTKNKAQQIKS
jgi:hypothetical protein